MNEARAQGPLLALDAGDAFSESATPAPAERDRYELRAHAIVQAMNKMGMGAFTPGERDLALGEATLTALAHEASFPFLAANLKTKADVAPFAASQLLTVGPLKLGVIGLVGQQLGLTPATWETLEFVVSDPVAAAAPMVASLKAQGVDAVVVLGHLDAADEQRLAKTVPGISLIIGGHAGRMLTVPKGLGSDATRPAPWLLDAGSKGKQVGFLSLYLGTQTSAEHWMDLTARVEEQRQVVAQARNVERAQLNLTKAKDETASSPEQRAKRLQGLTDELRRQTDALAKRRTAVSAMPSLCASDVLLMNTVTPVAIKIVQEPEVAQIVAKAQAAIDTLAKALVPRAKADK